MKKAQKIVDENGSISTSGKYGSIVVDSRDFMAFQKKEAEA